MTKATVFNHTAYEILKRNAGEERIAVHAHEHGGVVIRRLARDGNLTKPIGNSNFVALADVEFRVDDRVRLRALRTGERLQHADACGTLLSLDNLSLPNDFWAGAPLTNWVPVLYTPKICGFFHTPLDNAGRCAAVYLAERLVILGKTMYAERPSRWRNGRYEAILPS